MGKQKENNQISLFDDDMRLDVLPASDDGQNDRTLSEVDPCEACRNHSCEYGNCWMGNH